jgi:hypothetical protein
MSSSNISTIDKMSSNIATVFSTALTTVFTTLVLPKLIEQNDKMTEKLNEKLTEQNELIQMILKNQSDEKVKNQSDEEEVKNQSDEEEVKNQSDEKEVKNQSDEKEIDDEKEVKNQSDEKEHVHHKNTLPTHLKNFSKMINNQLVEVKEISDKENYPDHPTKIRHFLEYEDRIYLVEYPKNSTTNKWVEEKINRIISLTIKQFEHSGRGTGHMVIERYTYKQDDQWLTVERVEPPKERPSKGYRVIRSFGQFKYQEMRKIVSEHLDYEIWFRVSFSKNSTTEQWIGTSYGNGGKGYPHLIHMSILRKVLGFEGR